MTSAYKTRLGVPEEVGDPRRACHSGEVKCCYRSRRHKSFQRRHHQLEGTLDLIFVYRLHEFSRIILQTGRIDAWN